MSVRPDATGDLWRCDDCGRIGPLDGMDTVPHPHGGTIYVCRSCGSLEYARVCDEPGCARPSVQGWPDAAGTYRRTCDAHGEREAGGAPLPSAEWLAIMTERLSPGTADAACQRAYEDRR